MIPDETKLLYLVSESRVAPNSFFDLIFCGLVSNAFTDFKYFHQAGKTLSVRKWHAAFTPDGYLDIGRTLGRIHRGVSFLIHGFNGYKNITQVCEEQYAPHVNMLLGIN